MAYNRMLQDGGFNFSLVDPAQEQQFLQAAAGRQQRFDQANAALQGQLTALGETETYRPDLLQGRVGSLNEDVNKLVNERYDGDYGAAANEITRRIGQERRNPFYGLNREQVRQARIAEQFRLKNPERAIITGGGAGVDITQPGVTPQDLAVQTRVRTLDPEYIKSNLSAAGKKVEDFIAKESALGSDYYESITRKGLSALNDSDWNKILSDDDVQKYIDNSTFLDDPNILESQKNFEGAKDRLKDAINSIYGSQITSNFIRKPKATTGTDLAGVNRLAPGVTRAVVNPYSLSDDELSGKSGNLPFIKRHKLNNLKGTISPTLLNKYGYDEDTDVNQILSDSEFSGSRSSVKSKLKRNKAVKIMEDALIDPSSISELPKGQQDIINAQINLIKEDPNYSVSRGADLSSLSKDININQLSSLVSVDNNEVNRIWSGISKAKKFKTDFNKELKSNRGTDASLKTKFSKINLFTPVGKLNNAQKTNLSNLNNYFSDEIDLQDIEFIQSDFSDVDFKDQDELASKRDSAYEQARQKGNISIKGVTSNPEIGLVIRVETKDEDGNITEHIVKPRDSSVEQNILNAYNDQGLRSKVFADSNVLNGAKFLDEELPDIIESGSLGISNESTIGEMLNALSSDSRYAQIVPSIASAARYHKLNINSKIGSN